MRLYIWGSLEPNTTWIGDSFETGRTEVGLISSYSTHCVTTYYSRMLEAAKIGWGWLQLAIDLTDTVFGNNRPTNIDQ